MLPDVDQAFPVTVFDLVLGGVVGWKLTGTVLSSLLIFLLWAVLALLNRDVASASQFCV
jgi:hypothetical protein